MAMTEDPGARRGMMFMIGWRHGVLGRTTAGGDPDYERGYREGEAARTHGLTPIEADRRVDSILAEITASPG